MSEMPPRAPAKMSNPRYVIIGLIIVVLVLLGTALYYFDALNTANNQKVSLSSDLDQRDQAVALLNDRVSSLQSQMVTLNSQITQDQTTIADDEAKINYLQAQLNTNVTLVAQLRTQITSLNTQIATLESQLAGLTTQIAGLNRQIDALNAIVGLQLRATFSSSHSWSVAELQACSISGFSRCFFIDIRGIESTGGSIGYSGYVHISWSSTVNLNFWLKAGGSPVEINPHDPTTSGDYYVPVTSSPATLTYPTAAFIFDYYCGIGDCPGGTVSYTVSYVF